MQLTAEFYLRRISEKLSSQTQTKHGAQLREVRSEADLLAITDDTSFLSAAYTFFLGRAPDLEGFHHFSESLARGEDREAILGILRESAEAVYGATPAAPEFTLGAQEKVPDDWRLAERRLKQPDPRAKSAAAIAPQTVELAELLLISSPREFVQAAYRKVLRRDPDGPGLEHHVDILLRGVARESVLQRLCTSHEARVGPETFLLHGQDATRLNVLVRLRSRYRSAVPRRSYPALVAADRVEASMHIMRDHVDSALERLRQGHATVQTLAARLRETNSAMVSAMGRLERNAHTRVSNEKFLAAPLPDEASNDVLTKLDAIGADIERRQMGILASVEAGRASLGHVWSRVKSPVLPAGEGLVVTETGGFLLALPVEEWRLTMSLAAGSEQEPGLIRCFQGLVKPGMVVVDVGANVGLFSLHAALLAGREGTVFGFEPAPRTFAVLCENLRANGFVDGRRLVLRQAAVADQPGRRKLWIRAHSCGHDTLFPGDGDDQAAEVETVALDDVLAGEPRVDVIKVDAEGAEPLIWRGMQATLRRHPSITVLMEFAPGHLRRAGFDPAEFLNELASSGLQIREVNQQTGELLPANFAELCSAFSVNLCLRKE